MTTRANVLERVQIGKEATRGTAVAATKRMGGLSILPKPELDTLQPNLVGSKLGLATGGVQKEWTSATIEGDPTYSELAYLFASLITAPVSTIVAAGPAYKHVFTMADSDPDNPHTYTVEAGSATRALKFTHGLVNELDLKLSHKGIECKGAMIGQKLTDGIILTAAVPVLDPVALTASAVDLFIDTTGAGIGATQVTRNYAAEFSIKNRYGTVWPNLSSAASFADYVELRPNIGIKLKLEADTYGMGKLADLRAGNRLFTRMKVTGPVIAATAYTFQLDACVVLTGVTDYGDDDGVTVLGLEGMVAFDTAWAKGLEVSITNLLTAIS